MHVVGEIRLEGRRSVSKVVVMRWEVSLLTEQTFIECQALRPHNASLWSFSGRDIQRGEEGAEMVVGEY